MEQTINGGACGTPAPGSTPGVPGNKSTRFCSACVRAQERGICAPLPAGRQREPRGDCKRCECAHDYADLCGLVVSVEN